MVAGDITRLAAGNVLIPNATDLTREIIVSLRGMMRS